MQQNTTNVLLSQLLSALEERGTTTTHREPVVTLDSPYRCEIELIVNGVVIFVAVCANVNYLQKKNHTAYHLFYDGKFYYDIPALAGRISQRVDRVLTARSEHHTRNANHVAVKKLLKEYEYPNDALQPFRITPSSREEEPFLVDFHPRTMTEEQVRSLFEFARRHNFIHQAQLNLF